MRTLILFLILWAGIARADVEVRFDIPYLADGNAKHTLDLYVPEKDGKYPLVIFVHGGGWKEGDKSLYAFVGNYLAQNRMVCAVINYRLSPEVKHPAHCQDVSAAIAWVYQNGGNYRGDQTHLTLIGHSAGSHLAALVVLDPQYLRAHQLTPKAVQGVIGFSGVYQVGPLVRAYGSGAFTRHDNANPTAFVTPEAPRFLLLYGQHDIGAVVRQNNQFFRLLQKNHVPSQLVQADGKDHASIIMALPNSPYAANVLSFLQQVPTR